jgi:hypothetical protein
VTPFIELYAPNGTLVSSGSAIKVQCISKTGDYDVLVRDSTGRSAYSYDITLLQTPLPPAIFDFNHPYLPILRCDSEVIVRWPTVLARFDLQFTPSLPASPAWFTINPPYFQLDGYYYHTNTSAEPMRFFRLRSR